MGPVSRIARTGAALCALLALGGCARNAPPAEITRGFEAPLDDALHLDPPPPTVAPDPSVIVLSPGPNQIVASPVTFTIDAVAPQATLGTTEIHVFVDEPCAPAGSTVPVDEYRFALEEQVGTIEVEVEEGFHTFCVQAINAASARTTAATAELDLAVIVPRN